MDSRKAGKILNNTLFNFTHQQKQSAHIIMVTFWGQFAIYTLNAIFILFLIRPLLAHGLGYSNVKAYVFMGNSQAIGYLVSMLGGYMADNLLGVRRSILLGSILVALAYFLVMLSTYTTPTYGDTLFIAAYALIPPVNSLLMSTTTIMISLIYAKDAANSKSALTSYYMVINVSVLLSVLIAPLLFNSSYGPLSVFALTVAGTAIAAYKFARGYRLYDDVVCGKDRRPLAPSAKYILILYFFGIYLFTLFTYSHIFSANLIILSGCFLGIIWFLVKTFSLPLASRYKQLVACLLIAEAVVFFVIYNQMNTTLILFAQKNSNLHLLGFLISPVQYQMLNPILIILLGLQLQRVYKKFPRFSIPYQFACGTIIASLAPLVLVLGTLTADQGIVNGNYLGLACILISLGELCVSAVGLSMIGLYCDEKNLSFAMGVWYLAASLANAISGRLAEWASVPDDRVLALQSLPIYQGYYLIIGISSCLMGLLMLLFSPYLHRTLYKRGIILP